MACQYLVALASYLGLVVARLALTLEKLKQTTDSGEMGEEIFPGL